MLRQASATQQSLAGGSTGLCHFCDAKFGRRSASGQPHPVLKLQADLLFQPTGPSGRPPPRARRVSSDKYKFWQEVSGRRSARGQPRPVQKLEADLPSQPSPPCGRPPTRALRISCGKYKFGRRFPAGGLPPADPTPVLKLESDLLFRTTGPLRPPSATSAQELRPLCQAECWQEVSPPFPCSHWHRRRARGRPPHPRLGCVAPP